MKFILNSVLFYLTDNVTLYTFYSCLIYARIRAILRQKKRDFLGRNAHVAQSVEHILGKDEVIGSNPIVGSDFGLRTTTAGGR